MKLTLHQMIRIWCAFICFLLPHGSSLGQPANVDVCEYFTGTAGQYAEYSQGSDALRCQWGLAGMPVSDFSGPTVRLLISLLAQSAEQEKSLGMLRDELAKTADVLKVAVEALDAASKEIFKKNAKWRDDALKKNLDAIAHVPVNLAANETLRKAIAAAIVGDPDFLNEVKKAIK